jgi:hypothetical protein
MGCYDDDIITLCPMDNPQNPPTTRSNCLVGAPAFWLTSVRLSRIGRTQCRLDPIDGDLAFFDRFQRVLCKSEHLMRFMRRKGRPKPPFLSQQSVPVQVS